MTAPLFYVKLALTTKPTETPVWEDVSAYVRRWSFRRGRQSDTARVEAGTASVLVANRDRRFDPWYAGGPYYGFLKPRRRLQIGLTLDAMDYPLFTGYLSGWPQAYPASGKDAVVQLRAFDGLRVLAGSYCSGSYSEQGSGARIAALLDEAAWRAGSQVWVLGSAVDGRLGVTTRLGPSADRLIYPGSSTIAAWDYSTTPTAALVAIREVEAAEGGLTFVRKDGAFAFLGRQQRVSPPYDQPAATYGDGGGDEVPYSDVSPDLDEAQIVNQAAVTVEGGATYLAEDVTSKSEYFRASVELTLRLGGATAPVMAQGMADWLVGQGKDPQPRVTSVALNPLADARIWDQLRDREIGDRIRVRIQPMGLGDPIDVECHIESIEAEHDVNPGKWAVMMSLSRAFAGSWRLGASKLGSETRLYY